MNKETPDQSMDEFVKTLIEMVAEVAGGLKQLNGSFESFKVEMYEFRAETRSNFHRIDSRIDAFVEEIARMKEGDLKVRTTIRTAGKVLVAV